MAVFSRMYSVKTGNAIQCMLNVFLSHTSRTSHTDRQCGKCGKCGFIFCLAIYTRARQKSALAAYKHTHVDEQNSDAD